MIGRRRTISIAVVAGLSLLAPVIAGIGALVIDGEHIASYWTMAELGEDGQPARVSETIDFDFGSQSRHGILRKVPDLGDDPVVVSSATAPAEATQFEFGGITTVRVGDPDQTVSGKHRYLLEYSLGTLVQNDRFSWNALGTEWEVPVSEAEVHVLSNEELVDPFCYRGERGSFGECNVSVIGPGHLRILATELDVGEGITVSAGIGQMLTEVPEAPAQPSGSAPKKAGLRWLFLPVSLIGSLLGALVMSRWIQRKGRDQITGTAASTLGFISDVDSVEAVRLLDEGEMAKLIYPSMNPPVGLSAPRGAILVRETVRSEHQVAWLLEAAERGEIEIEEDDGETVLRRGSTAPLASTSERIESIFAKSNEVRLKKYDSAFAASWAGLQRDLEDWKERSGYWDPEGDRRRRLAIGGGVVLFLLGALSLFVFSGLFVRYSRSWLPFVFAGGLGAGTALALLFRSWELRVRSPEGTSRWIEVEALRRFLSELEPPSAADFIDPDLFAGYTPWAVALGFEDKWKKVIEVVRTDDRFRHVPARHFYLGSIGPAVSRSTSSASTAPSSSGGGGGGGVGGGGGGGGGGSW